MAIPAVRPAVKTALILTVWAVFAAAYFGRLPIPAFGQNVLACGIAFLAGLSAFGYGIFLLRMLKVTRPGFFETVLMSTVAGLGVLTTLLFICGCLQAWTTAGALALLIIGLLLARPFLRQRREFPKTGGLDDPSDRVPVFILGIGGLLSGLMSLTPVTYYDSLVYHFAMPAAYVQAHHWIKLPFLLYCAFPQNLEMLWTWGLLLQGDTVSNLMSWGITLLLVSGVITFGRRYFDRSVGLWAGALLTAMPAVLLLSSGGYIDIGLTCFSFFSLYALFLWREYGEKGWLVLAGLFAGWAIGTKYTGAIPAGLGAVVLSIECLRRHRSLAKSLALYTIPAAAIFAPWMIKNVLYFGNPVFPFFYHWGSALLNPWYHSAAAGYFNNLVEYQPRNVFQLLGLLWDSATQGLRFGGGMDVLGDFGWAPLLALLPALWLCPKRGWATHRLLLYGGLFIIPWGMSRPVLRFLMPLAPVAALLAAQAWVHGIQSQRGALRWAGRIFLGSLLASGGFLLIFICHILSPLSVVSGFESRSDYLSRQLNYYPAAHFLNTQATNVSAILVMGDQRGYYYDKPVMTTPVFSENPFIRMANEAPSPEALRSSIKQQGYSHLVVNTPEMNRLSPYHIFDFTDQGARNWKGLESISRKIFQDNACEVLEL